MDLKTILDGVEYTGKFRNTECDFVTDDSRKVIPGCAFVACRGGSFDGHDYARKALKQGASLLVCEKDLGLENQIVVDNSRKAYARMCSNLFGRPSEKMKMIAVTGTNGKTTTAFLIKDLLTRQGEKVGLMGTVRNMIGNRVIPAKFTTPRRYELHALLSQMYKEGCGYVVMEASSQALAQERLFGIHFDVAIFTNLTQDHLDYHGTMENYFAAKCILFDNADKAVINIDDRYGKRLAEMYKNLEVTTFSDKDDSARYTAKNPVYSRHGVKFLMVGKGSIARVDFPMPGSYSVQNAMGAALACMALGFDEKKICDSLLSVPPVRGRCEVLVKEPFTVICDFAHTGDGLENVLSGIKPFVKGKFVVLFGCAGQRDAAKRRAMARAVARYADYAVLTSDNPRKENASSIIETVSGYLREEKVTFTAEVDRRKAIKIALDMLQYNDTLILCGKGHEDYQVLDGITVYLDEHEIVREYMENYGRE